MANERPAVIRVDEDVQSRNRGTALVPENVLVESNPCDVFALHNLLVGEHELNRRVVTEQRVEGTGHLTPPAQCDPARMCAQHLFPVTPQV